MPRQILEDVNQGYEPDWSDIVEPYTSAFALGGDIVGLATAPSVVAAPIGATIAGVANIPNLIVDGYQTVRDWRRSLKDKSQVGNALWNTGELALGLVGAKYAAKGAKAITDRKVMKAIQARYEQELVKRNKKNWTFLKSKLTDEQIAKYISAKAMNVATNAKHTFDIRKQQNKKADKIARIATHSMSAPVNYYHARDLIVPSDNTRNVKKKLL